MNPSKATNHSVFKQRSFWSFVTLFLAWLYYFWSTIYSIFREQETSWITWSTYGISSATLLFIFLRRNALKNTLIASSQLGLLSLFIIVTGFIIADVENITYAKQSAVILMIPSLVLTVFGPMVIQTLIFPLLFLMLIIPLQDNTLVHREIFIWVAIGISLFYLRYLKLYKPKENSYGATPLWALQNARWLVPTGIGFCMLMVSPWLGDNIRSFYPPQHVVLALRFPDGQGIWSGPMPVEGTAWEGVYPNASGSLQKQYFSNASSEAESIYLYSAYYLSDRTFTDILAHGNSIYNPNLWKQVTVGSVPADIGNNQTLQVFEVELRAGAVSRLVWYWYFVAGYATTDLAVADLLDRVRVISKFAQGSGVVMVSTDYNQSPDEARRRLGSFLKVMYQPMDIIKRPEITYTQYNQ